ncbi:MAG: AAA family ATPase [Chloroflexi bacterium]|nr:AAA family ATPase [Chloroflexota bacterium]
MPRVCVGEEKGVSSKKCALALVGMPGSGKSTCAAHLSRRGLYTFRFGGIVTGEIARRGWALTPSNERTVREEFRAREGMDVMAKRALPYLRNALLDRNLVVIDGLYSFSEYTTLKRDLVAELIVIAIVSDRDLRYARLAARPERPLTRAEAEQRDIAEIVRLEKGGPIAIADYTLLNNGSPAELNAALDVIINRLIEETT